MRKIILGVAVSLDGYIEGKNGEYDWCFTDQDYGMSDFLKRIDTIFYGRKSYEMMLTANPFAAFKSYVFSTTLRKPYEGTTVIGTDWKEQVKEMKALPGKDIWLFGGASLTTSFLNEDLVDEMFLAVHPIVLGEGKPLFSNIDQRKHFKLINALTYSTGLVALTYHAQKAL